MALRCIDCQHRDLLSVSLTKKHCVFKPVLGDAVRVSDAADGVVRLLSTKSPADLTRLPCLATVHERQRLRMFQRRPSPCPAWSRHEMPSRQNKVKCSSILKNVAWEYSTMHRLRPTNPTNGGCSKVEGVSNIHHGSGGKHRMHATIHPGTLLLHERMFQCCAEAPKNVGSSSTYG
jgi:hypothetical protein